MWNDPGRVTRAGELSRCDWREGRQMGAGTIEGVGVDGGGLEDDVVNTPDV